MLATILFGFIGLAWGGLGLVLTVVPSVWLASVDRLLNDPSRRFMVTQGVIVAGLFLIVGTSRFQGYWLWATIGLFSVLKGLVILGSSREFRRRVIAFVEKVPLWLFRFSGVLTVLLASLFLADVILNGS